MTKSLSSHSGTQPQPGIDAIDRELIAVLASDGRIAISELAKRIGLSAPSTAIVKATPIERRLPPLG